MYLLARYVLKKPKVISGTIDKSRVFVVDFVSAAIISTDASLVLDIYPDLIKKGLC